MLPYLDRFLKAYLRVASAVIVNENPMSISTIPTINHANQGGISALSHLTAPTATKPKPNTAMITPARIKPTARAKRFTKLSTGFAAPPRTSRSINLTSFLASSGRSDSDNPDV